MGFRPVFKYENSYFIAARLMGIKQEILFFCTPQPWNQILYEF